MNLDHQAEPDADPDDEAQRSEMFLTFMLGGEAYGLSIRAVTEIIGFQNSTPVPDVPPYIRGIINLRGKVIPVMDVRSRFGMEPRDYDARTCIVVVRIDDAAVGLIVDTVCEVVDIKSTEIEDPPPIASVGGSQGFMLGIGKIGDEVKLLLDANRLLFDEPTTNFAPDQGPPR